MKVHLPKGTRDFLPAAMNRRLAVIDTVTDVFRSFGFEPLQTPAFERIETLTGKMSDENDKLMFKILKRGRGSEVGECDLALRYDLTVPLARVVAMNADLRMPFKRYQIQPVWRAERPQRGRFREFYQCDIDTIGSTSPVADAECIAVANEAISQLGFDDFVIRVNDRRILTDLAVLAGARSPAEESSFIIAIDKLDKVGRDGVEAELRDRLAHPADLDALWRAMESIDGLDDLLGDQGRVGLAFLTEMLEHAAAMGVPASRIRVDLSLARGADYYTGPVFEANVADLPGSIAGGGRYDRLIEKLSGRALPAVGVSLGLERLLVVMEQRDMLHAQATSAKVLVTVFSDETRAASIAVARALREGGIATEVFVGTTRLKSQMKYANARGFPWIAIVGPEEAGSGTLTLKNLSVGSQLTLDSAAAIAHLS
jgi:histidyl-tRNA synthetase